MIRINRIFIVCWMVFVMAACSHNPPLEKMYTISQSELDELKLTYYSDYFSFVGQDENGKVAFAIDNNRGQDQDTWQADHFLVLHDEKLGWQEVLGNGLYANDKKELTTIPDSDFFNFHGTAKTGMKIKSEVNHLELEIEPVITRRENKKGLSQFTLGSANAILRWKGREIKGRVIHEFLYLPGFNRLSQKYFGIFKDFHGIYAMTENNGDFYYHDQKSEVLSPLVGESIGFLFDKNTTLSFDSISSNVKSRDFTLGFYRWPTGWQGKLIKDEADMSFDLGLTKRNDIANWLIGGFAMGIINGELLIDGKKVKVYGLGELII